MLGGGDAQVGDDVEGVATTCGPAVDERDHDLRHESDEALRLQDVQAGEPGFVDGARGLTVGILVAGPAADPLVAAGTECPAAVLGARAVASEQHAPDVGAGAGVVEGSDQLVDGVRPEGVAHLGPVERDPHGSDVAGAVVGDVGETEAGDLVPPLRPERIGHGPPA